MGAGIFCEHSGHRQRRDQEVCQRTTRLSDTSGPVEAMEGQQRMTMSGVAVLEYHRQGPWSFITICLFLYFYSR